MADSLDYYSSQPGALTVERVLVTGGGMYLHGTLAQLEQRLGVPVVAADPSARVQGVPAGFEPVDLPFLAPYLPAAVGIALGGGRSKATRIDLLPERRRPSGRQPACAWWRRAWPPLFCWAPGRCTGNGEGRSAARRRRPRPPARSSSQIPALAGGPDSVAQAAESAGGVDPATVLRSALTDDPDWLAAARRLDEIHAGLGIELSNLGGTLTPSASAEGPQASGTSTTTTAAPATTATTRRPDRHRRRRRRSDHRCRRAAALGSLTVTATAPDLPAVATWLELVGDDPRFADAWVSAITPQSDNASGGRVQFTAEVQLTGENLVPRTLREPPR